MLQAHKVLRLVAACLALVAACCPACLAGLRGEYMNEMGTGYETPHVKWAKPYVRGRIRAFFIAPYTAAREVAEIAQRLDMDVAGESTYSDRILGGTDIYTAQIAGTSPAEKERALAAKLRPRYDVIVIANFDYTALPLAAQYRIAEQVTQGAGLVFAYRRNVRPEFLRHPDAAGVKAITAGVPFAALTFYRDVFPTANRMDSPAGIGAKVVSAYQVKQGRAVQLDFGIASDAAYGGFCLTPREYYTYRSPAEYEFHHLLVANAIAWAAKKEPPVRVSEPSLCRAPVAYASLPGDAGLSVTSASAGPATLEVVVRNPWGEVEHRASPQVRLAAGANAVPLRLPRLPGGMHTLSIRVLRPEPSPATSGTAQRSPAGAADVDKPTAARQAVRWAAAPMATAVRAGGATAPANGTMAGTERWKIENRKSGAPRARTQPASGRQSKIENRKSKMVLGWAAFALEVQPPARLAEVAMDRLSFERTESATGRALLADAAPAGCALDVHLLDNYGRLYARAHVPLPAGDREARFRLPLTHAVSLAGRCRVRLMRGSDLLDQSEAEFFVPRREIDTYPALLWGTFPGILGHYLNEQIREAGINTILLPHYGRPMQEHERGERRRISAASRDAMLSVPYFTHISGWSGALGDYPAYEKNRDEYVQAARFLAPYGPLVYSLGDENSIPDQAGFLPEDRAGFVGHLKGEYRTLEALNTAWGTHLASYEAAEPLRLDAAKRDGRLAQYHDTETYREELYARWHRFLHGTIRSVDPRARVGSEGSTPGDLEKTIAGLEFWGPYRDPVHNTLLRSLAPRSLIRGNWFGGYTSSRRDPAGLRRFLWETMLDGNNLFEVYCCYTCENIFNNDLTFGYWAREFLPDLKEVVDGIGSLQMASEHGNDPVAVYHSQPSLHAAGANPAFGEWRQAHLAALTLLSDAGYQPYYVTANQVRAGALLKPDRPRVLVLPLIQALSEVEVRELTAFAESGGILIADVATGILDEHCTPARSGAAIDLFGITREAPTQAARTKVSLPAGIVEAGRLRARVPALADLEMVADAGIDAGAGKAFGSAGDAPALIAAARGKGAAVMLNFGLAGTQAMDAAKRAPVRDLLASLVAAGGAEPFCRILSPGGEALPGCRVARFRHGDVVTLGILAGRTPGAKGPVPAVLRLERPAHVYDQRAKRYLGHADSFPLDLDPTSATMLSLLPYRVRGLSVSADAKAAPGALVNVSARLTADGAPRGHVFRLRVRDPRGRDRRYLARTLNADKGTATAKVPLALNDPAGKWTITLRDVATHLEQSARVTVGLARHQ